MGIIIIKTWLISEFLILFNLYMMILVELTHEYHLKKECGTV